MSYQVNDKELVAVLRLPAVERYRYFLGKVADWQELWSVGNAEGWSVMGDDSGQELIPVWPAERFAKLACVNEWEDRTPRSIPLDEWLDRWIPGMIADGRGVAVFPLSNDQDVVVEPGKLKEDIEIALSAYE